MVKMYKEKYGLSRVRRWLGFLIYLWHQLRRSYTDYRQLSLGPADGMIYGNNVSIVGIPILMVSNGGTVILGNDVVLDSSNREYHANLFAPVKLVAATPGARIEIGDQSRIHGTCIHARRSVRIGKRCLIAANCQIFDSNGHDPSFDDVDRRILTRGESMPIEIEDCVWLGIDCIVMPGVRIGRGTVVGAGSIVTCDLPPMCFAAGAPAKVIRQH